MLGEGIRRVLGSKFLFSIRGGGLMLGEGIRRV